MKTADPFYKLKRWRSIREKRLRMDGYMCQESKRYGLRVEGTEVHHILPREFFPEYRFELWNLVTLSQERHNMMHERKTHALTEEGWRLVERLAAKRGMKLEEIKKRMPAPSSRKH